MKTANTLELTSDRSNDADTRKQQARPPPSVVKTPSKLEVFCVSSKQSGERDDECSELIKPTRKRYFILLMYAICSMEKSFQWINLSAITNKVALFYGVDNLAVNWTSVLFMVTFIPLVLPTGWLIERIGLRKAILIGSTGIALGAIIKCFSCHEQGFAIVIWGQIIVSLSEQFIFCVPARIASVWFPDRQVSLATGIGIFGNQCGIALGFLVPQALLAGSETREQIGAGLWRLFLGTALVASLTLLVLLLLFDDAPKHAPGAARLRRIHEEQAERQAARSFAQQMRQLGRLLLGLLANPNCALLCLAYGLNVGSGYAIQTLLNQMIVAGQADSSADRLVGVSGLIVIVSGMLGALFWGHLCDLTRRYMLINKLLYLNAILSMCLFGFCLQARAQELVAQGELLLYLACALLGFHLIGYTVAGLDTAVELTYPAPELISTSLINISPQIFGTLIVFVASQLVDRLGTNAAVGFLAAVLCAGLLVTSLISETLNRQVAVRERERQEAARSA